MVGFEVTPTTASSSIIRASLPPWSSWRERKSIQTLWPSSDSWCRRDLDTGNSFLQLFDLSQTSDIALAAVEVGAEIGADEVRGERGADDFGAEAEHVHVVVLDALMRGVDVVTGRSADSRQLGGSDRGAHAGAADEDPPLGFAVPDHLADLARLVRIVDPLGGRVGAEINRLVAQCLELTENTIAQGYAAVVKGDCNPHQDRYVTRMNDVESWRELGQQLRVDSIRACMKTKSGHPTSSMSAADLMAVLLAKYLHYDFDEPENPNNDHLVFSKGHASPLLYSIYKAAGAVSDEELLTFRKFGSQLQGHPTPEI